jgi:hypothetical protein
MRIQAPAALFFIDHQAIGAHENGPKLVSAYRSSARDVSEHADPARSNERGARLSGAT